MRARDVLREDFGIERAGNNHDIKDFIKIFGKLCVRFYVALDYDAEMEKALPVRPEISQALPPNHTQQTAPPSHPSRKYCTGEENNPYIFS